MQGAQERREQGRDSKRPPAFFFSSASPQPRPLTFFLLFLFFRSLFSSPVFLQNATAAEAGKPLKMHHEKLAKKGGADEAGEGTK